MPRRLMAEPAAEVGRVGRIGRPGATATSIRRRPVGILGGGGAWRMGAFMVGLLTEHHPWRRLFIGTPCIRAYHLQLRRGTGQENPRATDFSFATSRTRRAGAMDGQEWTDAIRYRIAYAKAAAWAESSGSTTDGGANSPGPARRPQNRV